MAMIRVLGILLVFQCIGEAGVFALRLPVPGPVIGMALLVLYLMLRPSAAAALRGPSIELLTHLSLLFVPAGVGVMVHAGRLADEGWPIVVALVASTMLAIVVTALGVASHGIGTARAFQVSEEMGAFAGLGMGLAALLTAVAVPVLLLLPPFLR